MENRSIKLERSVHLLKDENARALTCDSAAKSVSEAKQKPGYAVPFLPRFEAETKPGAGNKLRLLTVLHEPFDSLIASSSLEAHLGALRGRKVRRIDLAQLSLETCLKKRGIRRICAKAEKKSRGEAAIGVIKTIAVCLNILFALIGVISDASSMFPGVPSGAAYLFAAIALIVFILSECGTDILVGRRFSDLQEKLSKCRSQEDAQKLAEIFSALRQSDIAPDARLDRYDTVIATGYSTCEMSTAAFFDRCVELLALRKPKSSVIVFSEYIPQEKRVIPNCENTLSKVFYLRDISAEDKKELAAAHNSSLADNPRYLLLGVDYILGCTYDRNFELEAQKRAEQISADIKKFSSGGNHKLRVDALILFIAHIAANYSISEDKVKRLILLADPSGRSSDVKSSLYSEEEVLSRLVFGACPPRRTAGKRARSTHARDVRTQTVNVLVSGIFKTFGKDFALIDYLTRYDSRFSEWLPTDVLYSLAFIKLLIHGDLFVAAAHIDLAYRQFASLSFAGERFAGEETDIGAQKLMYAMGMLELANKAHRFSYHGALTDNILSIMQADAELAKQYADSALLRDAVEKSIIFCIENGARTVNIPDLSDDALFDEPAVAKERGVCESRFIRYAETVRPYLKGAGYRGEIDREILEVINLPEDERERYLECLTALDDGVLIEYHTLLTGMMRASRRSLALREASYQMLLGGERETTQDGGMLDAVGNLLAVRELVEFLLVRTRDNLESDIRSSLLRAEQILSAVSLPEESAGSGMADVVSSVEICCADYDMIRCRVVGLVYFTMLCTMLTMINENRLGTLSQRVFYSNAEFCLIATPLSIIVNTCKSEDVVTSVRVLTDCDLPRGNIIALLAKIFISPIPPRTQELIKSYMLSHNAVSTVAYMLAANVNRRADELSVKGFGAVLSTWDLFASNIGTGQDVMLGMIRRDKLPSELRDMVSEYESLFIHERCCIDTSDPEAVARKLNGYDASYANSILRELILRFDRRELLRRLDLFAPMIIKGGTTVSQTLIINYFAQKEKPLSSADIDLLRRFVRSVPSCHVSLLPRARRVLEKFRRDHYAPEHDDILIEGLTQIDRANIKHLRLVMFENMDTVSSFENSSSFAMSRYLVDYLQSALRADEDRDYSVPSGKDAAAYVAKYFEHIEPIVRKPVFFTDESGQVHMSHALNLSYIRMMNLLTSDSEAKRLLLAKLPQESINRKFIRDIVTEINALRNEMIDPDCRTMVDRMSERMRKRYGI